MGLLRALPPLSGPRRPLASIPGGVPRPGQLPTGCAFAPRCDHATPACEAAIPGNVAVTDTHGAACLRVPELAA
jgi:peptide/nickel transport system ATP-binding protein